VVAVVIGVAKDITVIVIILLLSLVVVFVVVVVVVAAAAATVVLLVLAVLSVDINIYILNYFLLVGLVYPLTLPVI